MGRTANTGKILCGKNLKKSKYKMEENSALLGTFS